MIEEWRKVAGFDGYEISSLGRVRSWRPIRNFAEPPMEPRILKAGIDKDGYKKVVLYTGASKKDMRVCVLVAEAWHGERPHGMIVRHLDGSKDNDSIENLLWGTPKENSDDSKLHGTYIRGEKVNTCKLTSDDVIKIRDSNESCVSLASKYPVNASMISKIKKRDSWKHI